LALASSTGVSKRQRELRGDHRPLADDLTVVRAANNPHNRGRTCIRSDPSGVVVLICLHAVRRCTGTRLFLHAVSGALLSASFMLEVPAREAAAVGLRAAGAAGAPVLQAARRRGLLSRTRYASQCERRPASTTRTVLVGLSGGSRFADEPPLLVLRRVRVRWPAVGVWADLPEGSADAYISMRLLCPIESRQDPSGPTERNPSPRRRSRSGRQSNRSGAP